MSFYSLSHKQVKGVKEYRCVWCNDVIKKGELQISRAYIFEGEFDNDRLHLECADAMKKHTDLEDGFMCGEFKRGSCELQ